MRWDLLVDCAEPAHACCWRFLAHGDYNSEIERLRPTEKVADFARRGRLRADPAKSVRGVQFAEAQMGCVSSKVGQRPPEHKPGHKAREDGRRGESRAVESRPAQPVVDSDGERKAPASQSRDKRKGGPKEQARHGEGARRMAGGEEEREGETVTDATGLQMRTPRTSTDRGLHYAAKNGDLPLVHKLLGNSTTGHGQGRTQRKPSPRTATSTPVAADVDERGMWGNTPLLVATQYAYPQVALALIAAGANTRLENERQATALHFSCAEGLLDVGRALLEHGANVDPPVAPVHHPAVNGGQTVPVTPLSAASSGGHTELVRLLVERGAEVDRRVSPKRADGQDRRTSFSGTDGVGGSALTAAARYGHTETCFLLVDSGASVLLQDWDARTPLLHAILGGHAETSLALLDVAREARCARQLAGGASTTTGPSRLTPLHAACDNGMHTVVKALLAAGAQVESRDGAGATPLLCACRKGRLQCVRELLSGGADPAAKDDAGSTPLSAAQRRIERSDGEEILRLVEAAIAGIERRQDRDRAQPALRSRDSQRDADEAGDDDNDDNDDGEEEDVLLVSDWDADVVGGGVHELELDDCDVLDGPVPGPAYRDHGHHHLNAVAAGREPGRHTAEGRPTKHNDDGRDNETEEEEEEEEDVLLVGDYDADMEEDAILMADMPCPGSRSRRDSGSREVHSLSAENLSQVQKELASSGIAPSPSTDLLDRTLRHRHHPDEKADDRDRELRIDDPGGARVRNSLTKRDLDLHDAAGLEVISRPEGLSHVAADSVGMMLATAADRIVVGQPAGGG